MAGFRESLGNAYREAVCGSLDLRNQIAGLTLRRAPAALALVNAINGFQGLYCDRDDGATEDDIAPRPFQGGQCETVYDVTYTRGQISSTSTCAETTVSLTSGVSGPFTFQRGGGLPGDPSGNYDAVLNRNGQPSISAQWNESEDCPYTGFRILSIDAVVRRDGLPDDCGNPPRELPEPSDGWELPPVNFTYENDLGVTVNATANITLSPAINNDFSVSFPTNVQVGDINLSGELNLDGSLTLAPTINVNPAPESPSVGPELPGDEPQEPEETGDVLAGVIIRVTNVGNRATVLESIGSPDLVIPRAASVSFLQPIEDQEHWSSDYDAKNLLCFVPAPPGPESVDAAVTPYPGVVLSWRRVFRQERIPPDA